MMKIRKTISPYSYIKDKNGWIHVVRWYLDDQHIITKPYYSPQKKKQKKSLDEPSLPCGSKLDFISRYDYLIKNEHIDEIINPQIIRQDIHFPSDINDIINYYDNITADVFLFGSRLLKINKKTSDWDLIIDINDNPKDITDSLLKKNKELRHLNKYEIEKRVEHYSMQYPISNFCFLRSLFSKSCLYLKSPTINEIGLFFLNSDYQYDYMTNDIYKIFDKDTRITKISGTIKKGIGESFSFPRIFCITNSAGVNLNVISLSWEIGGIEELIGIKISINKTIKIGNNLYFMLDIKNNIAVMEDQIDFF